MTRWSEFTWILNKGHLGHGVSCVAKLPGNGRLVSWEYLLLMRHSRGVAFHLRHKVAGGIHCGSGLQFCAPAPGSLQGESARWPQITVCLADRSPHGWWDPEVYVCVAGRHTTLGAESCSSFHSVEGSLGRITTNKACEDDGIPAELFQIVKDDALKMLHSICHPIWKTQQWPQDWKRTVLIPIPKKGQTTA